MGKIYARAINPQQYDLTDVGRTSDLPGFDLPIRAHFLKYLTPYIAGWRDKSVLEIGSGVGWLLDLARKKGARLMVGLEPSQKSVGLAGKYYPQVTTISSTLENFQTDQEFDVVVSVLSIGHIADLEFAFKKISELLRPSGELLIITTDYDYGKRPRYKYKIVYEEIDEGSYVMAVYRPHGFISDIIRRVDKYQDAGGRFGLRLIKNTPMPPTEGLIKAMPRYNEMKNVPMTRLLRFVKK